MLYIILIIIFVYKDGTIKKLKKLQSFNIQSRAINTNHQEYKWFKADVITVIKLYNYSDASVTTE